MNNEAIASLSATSGVRGVAIFDDNGGCLANELPPPYEPNFVRDALDHLSRAFDVFASLDESDAAGFSMNCDEGCLVLRRSGPHTVIALTEPDINMNMLSVALNVATMNLNRSMSHPSTPESTRAFSSQLSHGSQLLSPLPDDAVGLPPDALDRAIVQQLLTLYRDYLGPAAKMVLKQQLDELGVTSRTLRYSQFGDLLVRLSRKIPTEDRQQTFLHSAQKLL